MGLVQQVTEYAEELSVTNLGNVYAAVPLARIAVEYNTTPTAIETYLRNLIQFRGLRATIMDGNNGKVLRFVQQGSQSIEAEAESRRQIIHQTRKIEELAAHVSEADRRLSLTREYLDYSVRKGKGGGHGGNMDEMGGFGGRPPSEDEDENIMMTDANEGLS